MDYLKLFQLEKQNAWPIRQSDFGLLDAYLGIAPAESTPDFERVVIVDCECVDCAAADRPIWHAWSARKDGKRNCIPL